MGQGESGLRDALPVDGWTSSWHLARYWIRERGAERDIVDTEEDSGQIATEVKIAFTMSNNSSTIAEEYM
jgi:hypothetical protein